MRLGLLADIHEQHELLARALQYLSCRKIDRFVILGDVFESGRELEKTVALLQGVDWVGVWGNHDFGLCIDVELSTRAKYGTEICEFFGRLQPRCQIDGCRIQHIEPHLNPERIEDLWDFSPRDQILQPEKAFPPLGDSHTALMGHLHQWIVLSPAGRLDWEGTDPLTLDPTQPHVLAIHAVALGYCAVYDTTARRIEPAKID